MAKPIDRPGKADLDESTMTRWVRDYAPRIRGYIASLVPRPDFVEDIVQEVFLKAWRNRDQYVDQGHEQAFLFRIADRLVIDLGRARRADSLDPDLTLADPRSREPIESLIQSESGQVLRASLDTLSNTQRRVLLLRYFGNLPFEEIASVVGCPLNTTLSHARRGLEQLRSRLAPSHATKEAQS